MKRRSYWFLSGLLVLVAAISGCGKSSTEQGISSAIGTAQQINVALPEARSAVDDSNMNTDRAAVISIPEDNAFYFGKDKISLSDVQKKVWDQLYYAAHDLKIVYIKGGKRLRFGTAAEVIRRISKMGYDRIGLVVDRRADGQALGVIEVLIPMPAGKQTDTVAFPPPPLPPGVPATVAAPPPPPSPGTKPAPTPATVIPPNGILVTLISGAGADQVVSVNNMEVQLSSLQGLLTDILSIRRDKTIFVAASEEKSFGDFVSVLDAIKGAGAKSIKLAVYGVVLPETDEPPPTGLGGIPGGVPGGVLGGVPGGVLGGVPGGVTAPNKSKKTP